MERHVDPTLGRRLHARAPRGRHERPHDALGHLHLRPAEETRQLVGVEHRLRRDVEGAGRPADDREAVRLRDVVGVRHLEAEPRRVRHERDRPPRDQRVRHPATGEQSLRLRPHGPLEDERRPQSRRRGRRRSSPPRRRAAARPRSCRASRSSSGCRRWASSRRPAPSARGVRAHRGRVHERGDVGGRDGVEDARSTRGRSQATSGCGRARAGSATRGGRRSRPRGSAARARRGRCPPVATRPSAAADRPARAARGRRPTRPPAPPRAPAGALVPTLPVAPTTTTRIVTAARAERPELVDEREERLGVRVLADALAQDVPVDLLPAGAGDGEDGVVVDLVLLQREQLRRQDVGGAHDLIWIA